MNKKGFMNNTEIPKLKNCATIKITIKKTSPNLHPIFNLQLIHEGEIDQETTKTYLTKKMVETKKIFTNLDAALPFKIDPSFKEGTINIFLIRHGEGEHNRVKGYQKFRDRDKNVTDAMLTDLGKRQAIRCAMFLSDYLSQANNQNPDDPNQTTFTHIYASRLRRAFHTADLIMATYLYLKKLSINTDNIELNIEKKIKEENIKEEIKKPNEDIKEQIKIDKIPITILPCSHELTVSSKLNIFNTAENSSLCTTKSRDNINLACKPEYYKINWELFNSTFSKWHKSEYLTCSLNNNMIQFIIRDIFKKSN
jgi:phosphohistidine phosphatase SixA